MPASMSGGALSTVPGALSTAPGALSTAGLASVSSAPESVPSESAPAAQDERRKAATMMAGFRGFTTSDGSCKPDTKSGEKPAEKSPAKSGEKSGEKPAAGPDRVPPTGQDPRSR